MAIVRDVHLCMLQNDAWTEKTSSIPRIAKQSKADHCACMKQRKEGNAKDGGECRRQKSAGGKKGKRAYPFRANICSFKIANLIARMYLSAVPLCWSTHRGAGPQTARREA